MDVSNNLFTWLKEVNLISNTPFSSNEQIKLSEEDSDKLELGLIIPLLKIYADNLPTESDMKHNNTNASRLYNWNLLIKPLESLGVVITSEIKSLIIAGDRMQVIEIIKTLKNSLEKVKKKKLTKATIEGALLLDNIDLKSQFHDTESLLEFLVLSCCKAFNISPKVAAGLLAKNCSFLAQVIIKGLKRDSAPILTWYDIIENNISHLGLLIEKESNALILVLSCLKSGLNSKFIEIIIKATETLIFFYSQFKKYEKQIWDWSYLQSDLYQSCFLLIQSTPEVFNQVFSLLFEYSKANLNEVFIIMLKDFCENPLNYIKFIQKCMPTIISLDISQYFYTNGLVEIWISICLKEAESEVKSQDKRAFYVGFLCDIWCLFSNYLQLQEDISNSILAIIKKIARDGTRSLKFVVFGRVFYILSIFAETKNAYAPIVYKTLIFCIIENYSDERIREFMLLNMITILNDIPTIPINAILDPIIKQAQSWKNSGFSFTDFEFFITAARHPRFNIKEGVLLIDLCGKIMLNESIYFSTAEVPFLIIISRFIDSNLIQEYILKFISLVCKLRYSDITGIDEINKNPLRNVTLSLFEKIIRFNNIELNKLIKDFFNTIYSEIKKFKDKKLEKIFKMLPDPFNNMEDTRIQKFSPRNDLELCLIPNENNQLRVIMDIEKIKQKRLVKENQERQNLHLKSLQSLLKKKALRKELKIRRIELGVKSKLDDSDIGIFPDMSNREGVVQYSMINEEIPEDIELIKIIKKKYSRVNKMLFNKYSASAYNKILISAPTFDNMKNKKESLTESDFAKMLREFGIFSKYMTIDEMKGAYVYLITRLKVKDISYDNFPELIFLIASIIFNRDPFDLSKFPPAIWLSTFYQLLRENHNLIVPKYIFDEPDPGYGDRDVVTALNKKLEKNPDHPVPDNYKKYKEISINIEYKATCGTEKQRIVIEIIDGILVDALNIHFLMPVIEKTYKTRAKGIITINNSRSPSIKYLPKIESTPGFSKLSANIKYHAVGLYSSSNEAVIECAQLIDDLIYSVEKNSFTLISKVPKPAGTVTNRVVQEKMMKELERYNQSERAEQKRKIRIKKVNEEATQIKLQREYQEYLENEAKKKEILKAKFKEKIKKKKKDKERFEIEERILEYKLNKIESQMRGRQTPTPEKKIWKISKVDNKITSTSVDLTQQNSSEYRENLNKNNRNKAISAPRLMFKSNK